MVLMAYTGFVIANHGWNLGAVFFGDMAAVTWPGQFNLDFFGFLMLSAWWTAWRHRFSPLGLALAPLALLGGMMFLTVYLLIASTKARTITELITGRSAAA